MSLIDVRRALVYCFTLPRASPMRSNMRSVRFWCRHVSIAVMRLLENNPWRRERAASVLLQKSCNDWFLRSLDCPSLPGDWFEADYFCNYWSPELERTVAVYPLWREQNIS